MQTTLIKQQRVRKSKMLKPQPQTDPPKYEVIMACPICNRRAFDLSIYPHEPIWIGLKCPNCNNIIHVPCAPLTKQAAIPS